MDGVFSTSTHPKPDNIFEAEDKCSGVFASKSMIINDRSNISSVFAKPSTCHLDQVFCQAQVSSPYVNDSTNNATQNEYEVVRCTVCGNIVRAKVLERTAMISKYKCTYPGCNALFSTDGPVAQAAKMGQKLLAIVNIGIAGCKLLSGDFSDLRNIANDLGSLAGNG